MSLLGNEYVKEYNIEDDLNEDIEINRGLKKIYWNGYEEVYKCLETKSVSSSYKIITKFDNLKQAMNWLKEE